MIRSFSLALDQPLETARETIDERAGFLFARDDGLGEATPLPGWTESYADCLSALTVADQESNWEWALEACEDAPAARHAVSLACLDAEASSAGEPIAASLADDPADSVPVNATVGDADVDATRDAVETAVDAGYETVKVKVGARAVDDDLERLRAARDAADSTAGSDTGVSLRVDANGAWSRDEASDAFDALAGLDLEYVEQPLPAANLASYQELRTDVPVALDESLLQYDLADVLDVADYAVLKPMALGGIDRTRDVAMEARNAGVEPVISTTIDAVVARTAAVHLAASIPDVPACGLATGNMLATDLAEDPAPVADGRIPVPDAPGHGVEVEFDA